MKKDQFDSSAEWLVVHLANWETLRRGFSTVESANDNRTRVGIIAAFLREDFWNRPDGSRPPFEEALVLPHS